MPLAVKQIFIEDPDYIADRITHFGVAGQIFSEKCVRLCGPLYRDIKAVDLYSKLDKKIIIMCNWNEY